MLTIVGIVEQLTVEQLEQLLKSLNKIVGIVEQFQQTVEQI